MKKVLVGLLVTAVLFSCGFVLYARQASRFEERCRAAPFGREDQVQFWYREDVWRGHLVCFNANPEKAESPARLNLPLFDGSL